MRNSQRKAMALKQHSHRQSNLTLIYGPPCAGKTTRALAAAAKDGGVVVDYDLIAQELGSPVTHGHDEALHQRVIDEVQRRLNRSRNATSAYLVKCEPTRADLMRATRKELVDPGLDVCLERAVSERPAEWVGLIQDWYARNSIEHALEGVGVTPDPSPPTGPGA